MAPASGRYTDWRQITYNPAITEVLPSCLLRYLSPGQTVLEIGCYSGNTALFLAQNGMRVLGLDLNASAIQMAQRRAKQEGLESHVEFQTSDFVQPVSLGNYDAIVLIRVLTCVPDQDDWTRMLSHAFATIRPGGIIYVNDFMLFSESENYGRRYQEGAGLGWREGNFAVRNEEGEMIFVAHHHSPKDVEEIAAPYEKLSLRVYQSFSMNGNPCRMFEFIGRKT